MDRILSQYLMRYGRRDIVLLALYAIIVITIYLSLSHQCKYDDGLGDIRHKVAQWWVIWNALYAFITAFNGYQSLGRSYETILLPVSPNKKFLFTVLRIFIFVPVISATALLFIDMGLCRMFDVTPKVAQHASTMWNALTYTGSLYHKLPIMPYYLLMFCSISLVVKTIGRRKLPLLIILAILFLMATVYFGPHFEYGQYNYPFIAGKISASYHGTTVSELVSWTNMGAKLQRIVSYAFLVGMPVSIVCLSYLRFKELEVER